MLGKKLENNGREKVFWWKMAELIVYTVKFICGGNFLLLTVTIRAGSRLPRGTRMRF